MEASRLIVRAARDDAPAGLCAAGDAPVSIGSWAGATLPLSDGALWPVHVVLDPEGPHRYRLVCLAPDGVEVNGHRTRRAFVGAGDRLRIGPYALVLEGAAGPAVHAPPPGGEQALEARLSWHGTMLDARVLAPTELVTVGDGGDATFRLPLEAPGDRQSWVAAACLGGVWHVALDAPLRAVETSADSRPLLTTSARTDGPKLRRGQQAGRLWAPLPPGATVSLAAGELAIELRRTERHALEKVARPAWWTTREGQGTIISALVLAFVLGVLAHPPVGPFQDDDAGRIDQSVAQYQVPVKPTVKLEVQRWKKELQKAERESARAKSELEEGAAGRPDAALRNAHRAGPKSDAEIVKEHALLKALSGGATDKLLSGGALSAASSVGHLSGAGPGDAKGTLGLGLRGVGPGGGGLSADTVGVGPVGSRGVAGAGNVGRLGHGGPTDLGIDEPSNVTGGLDREVIRRVILSHRVQIRYCYEKELSAHPELAGKVAVEFTIAANGQVTTARVGGSSLTDPEVGQCIVSKVRTWTFPKPKGGGVVVVTYPFLFKPAGGK